MSKQLSNGKKLADIVVEIRRNCDHVSSDSYKKFGNYTRSQQNVLLLLGNRGCLSMTEIATALNKSLSTLTSITDKLVKCEFITRVRDDKDRRAVKVKLTPKGYAIFEENYAAIVDLTSLMLEALDSDEQKTFLDYYQRVVDHLNQQDPNQE